MGLALRGGVLRGGGVGVRGLGGIFGYAFMRLLFFFFWGGVGCVRVFILGFFCSQEKGCGVDDVCA